MIGSTGGSNTSRSSSSSSTKGATRSSNNSSMASARAADRASVKGYSGKSSFASSTAAARAADRASVMGYTHGSLKTGMKGDAVKSLQSRLQASGFDPGSVDGKFGKRTASALRDYQRAMGLGADGVAGRKTFDSLNGFKSAKASTAVNAGKTVKGPVGTQLPGLGVGFKTYGPRSMQYGTAQTVKNMQDIAARYHARTGRTLEIGDLSKQNGGFTSRHKSHAKGIDVDVRPPSLTGGPTKWNSKAYDRKATRALVEEIRRTNPTAKVLFNDPVLRAEGLTSYSPGHDNHLHISFR